MAIVALSNSFFALTLQPHMDGAAKAYKLDIRVQQTHFSRWPFSTFLTFCNHVC